MRTCRCVILAVAVAIAVAGSISACSQKGADDVATATAAALDKTKKAADVALDATMKGADKAGEVITDAWLTTKVTAKLADEQQLKGSSIAVDTSNHVVRLKGTVASVSARNRAGEIARGTDGVTGVVNELVVK